MIKQPKTKYVLTGMLSAALSMNGLVAMADNLKGATSFESTAIQADRKIIGTVVDENGEPLIGATVVVKGKKGNGTVTDVDGHFTLNVPEGTTLSVSFIGYVTQHINAKKSMTVQLRPDASDLDEVVVVGYGTQRRGELTGSISSLAGAKIENMPVASVGEALAGRMAGVQVTSDDGSPDADIQIRVRGGGSITQDNSPLYIVDGFPVDNIKDIPPMDIESIDVLKDASATAVYGARGANGVVIVTTKSAKAGKTSINFNAYVQTRKLAKKLDVMDSREFVMMQYEYARLKSSDISSFTDQYGDVSEFPLYSSYTDDWQEQVLGGSCTTQNYNLSIMGASERTRYSLSFTHNDAPSILAGNGQKKTSINAKLSTQLAKRLRMDWNTRFNNDVVDGRGTDGVKVLDALEYAPTQGLKDFMTIPDDLEDYAPDEEDYVQRYNPLEQVYQSWRKRARRTFNMQAGLTWDIMKNLTFRSEFGVDFNYNDDRQFFGEKNGTAVTESNGQPMTYWTKTEGFKYRWANTLSYKFKLNKKHNINAMVGQEINHNQTKANTQGVRFLPVGISPERAFDNQGLGEAYKNSSTTSTPNRIASFFGRVNYDYEGRYMLTFTMRADGSTKFAPGKQWGYFPAGAVGWRISEEPFMQNLQFISNLKLRASIGMSGNNRISDDMWRNVYKIATNRSPGWGNSLNSYYWPSGDYLTNPNLKWETTITRNLGLDYGLFNGRLYGSIEAYWNTTKDLLVPSDIPTSTGFKQQLTNIGQTSNRGVEFTVSGQIINKKDFTLSATLNLATNKNKVDKLAEGETQWEIMSRWASTDQLPNYDYRMIVGQTTGLMYGYVNDGIYSVDDFDYDKYLQTNKWVLKEGVVDCSSLVTVMPGAPKFRKFGEVEEGEKNPRINDDDIVNIGNANPKLVGGFGIDATYKGFDLNLFFNFMVGHDVYNGNKMHLTSWWRNNQRCNLSTMVDSEHRFRYFDNDGTDLRTDPVLLAEYNRNATIWNPTTVGTAIMMTANVEDGSFLRLSNATIGYTLPRALTSRIGINKLRVYLTGSNLFIITKYTGYDPEVNIQRGLSPNIDCNVYPRSRAFTAGINLTF